MFELDEGQKAARAWFETLRDRICCAFEEIEREENSEASFAFIPWERTDSTGEPGGGGVRGLMTGKVFEKVGVNVSTVGGRFSPEFAKNIPGAEGDPRFFATGISLVAHMANPHVPAVHMNTRFLTTTKRWFGGGADLNPAIEYDEDTKEFHAGLRAACAAHDPTFYPRFSKWADDYFWLPHRGVSRGVGGIFFDYLEDHFDAHFAFTKDIGEAFLETYPKIVRRRKNAPFTDQDMRRLLEFRGRYVEFNLLYDRGTLFGLKTGGNVDAILIESASIRELEIGPFRWAQNIPIGELRERLELEAMALEDLAPGEVGTIVTYLEMWTPPSGKCGHCELEIRRIEHPSAEQYRRLFTRVGSKWLWFSRLIMPEPDLMRTIADPNVKLYAIKNSANEDCGILELDFREKEECEIAFLGLVPELAGKGLGRWLLGKAVELAWIDGVKRVHVHTCSLDHPAALSAYLRAGFKAYKRAIERFPDPRFLGILPKDCAPQLPLFGTDVSVVPTPER